MKATASARKSNGEYKPLISFSGGRTEVVEQSSERAGVYTKHGFIAGNRYARGSTYDNRADAIAAAQAEINRRRADLIAHAEKNEALMNRADTYTRQQIEMYS